MNDPRLETCPDAACAGPVKRKIGTGAGILFKGSGFYATDYRSAAYASSAKKDSSSAEGSSSGSASEATKPAPAAGGTSCCSGGGCKHG